LADRAKLKEITSLSSFGILLVVFGHSYCDLKVQGGPFLHFLYFLRFYIYSFHMPLFMFISGYLFCYTTRSRAGIPYPDFVWKKIKRLLVPYFMLTAIAFPEKVLLAKYAWRHTTFDFNLFAHGLIYPLSNINFFFWFLPTLFIIFLAAPAMRAALRSRRSALLAALITLGLAALNVFNPLADVQLLNLAGVARYFIYFWLGCLFVIYKPREMSGPAKAAAFVVFFGALTALNVIGIENNYMVLAAAVCGIFAAFFFINIYINWNFDIFGPINGFSYQIYLLSWFFQTVSRISIYQILKLGFYPTFAAMFITGLIGPVLVAKFVKRYTPKLGFIIGMNS